MVKPCVLQMPRAPCSLQVQLMLLWKRSDLNQLQRHWIIHLNQFCHSNLSILRLRGLVNEEFSQAWSVLFWFMATGRLLGYLRWPLHCSLLILIQIKSPATVRCYAYCTKDVYLQAPLAVHPSHQKRSALL